MDYTEKILYYMNLFLVAEQRSSDKAAPFKVRAYENAIEAVKYFDKPIRDEADVKEITGIGDKIRKKMIEIVQTGNLKEAEGLEDVEKVRNDLLNVFGIGPKIADDFIKNYNIKSIEDLQSMALDNPDMFTKGQLMGLAFYSDFKQRIPRKEMMEHENFLREFFLELVPEFSITIAGSYRRGEATSGDVDVLLTYHGLTYNQAVSKFTYCIDKLLEYDYIIGSLAKGKTKFLGVCRFDEELPARRIDIVLTKPEEFACALLYFTGSQKFNVSFRKVAILKGYTLNEHQLTKTDKNSDSKEVPIFKTEKDIFKFLGIVWQEPHQRVGPVEVILPVSMI